MNKIPNRAQIHSMIRRIAASPVKPDHIEIGEQQVKDIREAVRRGRIKLCRRAKRGMRQDRLFRIRKNKARRAIRWRGPYYLWTKLHEPSGGYTLSPVGDLWGDISAAPILVRPEIGRRGR